MPVTKKIKHKTAEGTVIEAEIGADAKNVTEDTEHRFVTDEEKAKWNRMERVSHTQPVTLLAAGWTGGAAPYAQTVSVEGVTEADEPFLVSMLEDGADTSTQEAYNKAFGCVAAGTGTTGDGTVTFKVYKKPEMDLVVGLRGV